MTDQDDYELVLTPAGAVRAYSPTLGSRRGNGGRLPDDNPHHPGHVASANRCAENSAVPGWPGETYRVLYRPNEERREVIMSVWIIDATPTGPADLTCLRGRTVRGKERGSGARLSGSLDPCSRAAAGQRLGYCRRVVEGDLSDDN